MPPASPTESDESGSQGETFDWSAFMASYSPLLIAVAQRMFDEHDRAMDAYVFVLEKLREDGCRRLRTFEPDGEASFRTWLAVVARRLCLDHRRHVYGRVRESTIALDVLARRNLAEDLGSGDDIDRVADTDPVNPEVHVLRADLALRLRRAFEELPPRDRLLLSLRFGRELTGREIAEFLGLKDPFRAYRQVNAALSRLRRLLHARGVDETDV